MINVTKLYCQKDGRSDHLRYSGDGETGPVIVFNCTEKCNLKCRHCYSYTAEKNEREELDTGTAKKMIDSSERINSPVILFSGGEPLMRDDIFELIEYTKKKGLTAVISTNGTMLGEKTAVRLKELGLKYAGISIDGPEEFHDLFRGMQGAFEKSMSAFQACRKAGLRAGLRFTITRQNYEFIPFIFELAVEKNIKRICFYHLINTGRAMENESSPAPEQTKQSLDTIFRFSEKYQNSLEEVLTVGNHADGPYILIKLKTEPDNFGYAEELLRKNGGNRTGEKIICIDSKGNVHPDQFWRNYSFGNIKEATLEQILKNDDPVLEILRNKDRYKAEKCSSCKWFEYCRGNFRFTGESPEIENWINEPACYLSYNQIK